MRFTANRIYCIILFFFGLISLNGCSNEANKSHPDTGTLSTSQDSILSKMDADSVIKSFYIG